MTLVIPKTMVPLQEYSQMKCVTNNSYEIKFGVETNIGSGISLPEEAITERSVA